MKKVLVTGASGQLGWTIQQISSNYPEIEFVFKSSLHLDITDENLVESTFNKGNFDYCINCAAYTNVEQAEKTPEVAFKVNAEAVKNIANACKKNDVTLIHISTDYVFDGEKKEPYTVYDTPNPLNEYGKSKLKGEQNIQQILSNYYIVRTSWLYCKVYGKNFYRFVLDKARKGENLKIVDNQISCPTDTFNLSKFLIKGLVASKKSFGLYHYSDGQPMSWYEFAKEIIFLNDLGSKAKLIAIQDYCTFASRPAFSALDTN